LDEGFILTGKAQQLVIKEHVRDDKFIRKVEKSFEQAAALKVYQT
jgi:hypothetical protein